MTEGNVVGDVHAKLLALFPAPAHSAWDLELIEHTHEALGKVVATTSDAESLLQEYLPPAPQTEDSLVLAFAMALVVADQHLAHEPITENLVKLVQRCQTDAASVPSLARRIGLVLLTGRRLATSSALRSSESPLLETDAIYHVLTSSFVENSPISCHVPVEAAVKDLVVTAAGMPATMAPRLLAVLDTATRNVVQGLYQVYPVFLHHQWPSSASFLPTFQSLLIEGADTGALAAALPPLRALTLSLTSACLKGNPGFDGASMGLDVASRLACVAGPDAEAPVMRQLALALASSVPPSQMSQLLQPLQATLDAVDAVMPLDVDCIRGKQLTQYLQLLPFLGANETFELALRGLPHNLVEVNLACHRSIRSLLLQRRPGSQFTEMAAVYLNRMLQSFPTVTPIEVLTTSLGYVLSLDDDAVNCFCALRLQETIRDAASNDAATLARLLFELLKVVSMHAMGFYMRIAEQVVYAQPSLANSLFDAISTACEASRRTILTEWYLKLRAQLGGVPSLL
ncbi:hypothetical protein ACHHYP_14566 [Achlya hypogyna]|uniref:Uncharacterized protein n=1 Tax=Achlya hypogyna TaxID=1202772 RepID=A0A1V9YCY4_ACHHY|nr:hypothetical protein ACHHYP_14566 [Achlya hypogyna]